MKKIQKGFTLVELIVVMAIMGIIMVVIMSIINPTSRIASKVQSMNDEETTAIQVGRAIKKDLCYATKVFVTAADDGEDIPSPQNGPFKYVYEIDNTSVRGQSKKGAKGMISLGQWVNGSISGAAPIVQEPVWGEDEFKITIDNYSTATDNYYLNIAFTGCPMVYKGGASYEPDHEHEYKYSEAITFININNKAKIVEGGNSNAADFSFNFDAEALAAKSDKIYIFFNAAADTALSVTGGTLLNGGDDESSEGGSTEDDSSSQGGIATPVAMKVGEATFFYTDPAAGDSGHFTSDIMGISTDGSTPKDGTIENIPDGDYGKDIEYADTEDYKYVFKGWSTVKGDESTIIDGNKKFNGSVSLYPCYEKKVYHEVDYRDWNNTHLITEKVADGEIPQQGFTFENVLPDDEVFEKWITDDGIEYGQPITKDVTYTAVKTKAKGFVTIHFLSPFKGKINVTCNNNTGNFLWGDYGHSQGVPIAYGTENGNLNREAGEWVWIKVTQPNTNIYMQATGDNSYAGYSWNIQDIDFASRDYYIYIDNNGDWKFVDTEPQITNTYITTHMRSDETPSKFEISNGSGIAVTKLSGYNNTFASLKGGKIDSITPWNGAVFVASTNLTFKANDAEIKINNDGVNKHLFLYTDIDGQYKAVVVGDGEPEPWTKYAKMTVNFLENISSDEMSVSAGTYYLGSTGKVGNGEWNRLEDNVGYGKNNPFVFKYAQESTLNIGGATLTLPCDGSASDPVANYSTYYYNGEYYNTKEAAEAKYAEDHAGQLSDKDFGGPLPDGDSNGVTYVMDVPAGSMYKYIYLQASNVSLSVYEAKSGTKLNEDNSHYKISDYLNSDTRFIIKITNFPSWANQDNKIGVMLGFRVGTWNETNQILVLNGNSNNSDKFYSADNGKVSLATADK